MLQNKQNRLDGEQGEALLPCPFCGGNVVRRFKRAEFWWIECPRCEMQFTRFSHEESKQNNAWNTRAPSSTVAGAQEKNLEKTEADVNAGNATRQKRPRKSPLTPEQRVKFDRAMKEIQPDLDRISEEIRRSTQLSA